MMFEENVFTAHCSPLRAWTILSDFEGYRLWHPEYAFGAPETDNIRPLTWRFQERDFTFDARIVASEKGQLVHWHSGMRHFASLDETYRIMSHPSGVEIIHRMELAGIVGGLVGRSRRSWVRRSLQAKDAAFTRYLKKLRRHGPSSSGGPGRRPVRLQQRK
jgi:hypothetical protein